MIVQDVINAIRKNGYPQVVGYLGNKYGACAIGQAALNLDVEAQALTDQLGNMKLVSNGQDDDLVSISDLANLIIHYNDRKKLTCTQIADLLERKLPAAIKGWEVGEPITYE